MQTIKFIAKQNLMKSKKGSSGINKVPAMVMLMGLSIVLGVILTVIVADVRAVAVGGNESAPTYANATEIGTVGKNGIVKIFSFFVLIGLVVAAGIVIKILTSGFGGK